METKTTNVGGMGRKSVYNFIAEFIKENVARSIRVLGYEYRKAEGNK